MGVKSYKSRQIRISGNKMRHKMRYIKVKYIGLQHTPHRGSFKLYNLLEQMNEHPIHSTVSLNTIHANGFEPIEVQRVEG